MNLRVQVEPLVTTALQASSNRGMHTARHRGSLKVKHWLNRTLNPSQTRQGRCRILERSRRLSKEKSSDFTGNFEWPILGRTGQLLANRK
jgi:hypothetical protein